MKNKVEFEIISELVNSDAYIEVGTMKIKIEQNNEEWSEDCGRPNLYIFKEHAGASTYPSRHFKDISAETMFGVNEVLEHFENTIESEQRVIARIEKYLKNNGYEFFYFSIGEHSQVWAYVDKAESANGIVYAKKSEFSVLKEQQAIINDLTEYLEGDKVDILLIDKDNDVIDSVNWASIYDAGEILVDTFGINPKLTKISATTYYKAS